jgi:hypothetical protein
VSKSSGAPRTQIIAFRHEEPPTTRPREAATVCVRLRHGLVRPVLLREPELVQPAGIVDRRVLVAPAGLEQDHAGAAVDEAARDDAAGGAGANDDDVRAAPAHVNETQTLLTALVSPAIFVTQPA